MNNRTFGARARRELIASRIHARRAWRTAWIVGVAILAGTAGAYYARLCDLAIRTHTRIGADMGWPVAVLLPLGFAAMAWVMARFSPESSGSGIPQVIAAAEQRWKGRWGGQRVTIRTAAWKVVISAVLLVCGASIGREGPTVQVVAGIQRSLTRGLKGGPGRRALILAGGAAGIAAAFNTPIAGVVFAFEELAKSFERRTHTTVILVVVAAGFTSYALQGDYAYFGALGGPQALGSAWLAAPAIGIAGGLMGGFFSRVLAYVTGPDLNPVNRWRRAHPVLFAFACGLIAAAVALATGGLTYGAGYDAAKSLLQGHPGRGMTLAVGKLFATLAASCAGLPGGIFAPSLAAGAGLGAAFARLGLGIAGRDAVVLGMTSYLSGVVQSPLTSAVILMEMTRDPGLVGPLMLAALIARWASGLIMDEPIYHVLSRNWRLPPEPKAPEDLSAPKPAEA
ncbi:MAG: chloride channel protein [Alphaproteobacteria bacterium]|nr:chloride channel protein [Alphaproteobacteria bacterium]